MAREPRARACPASRARARHWFPTQVYGWRSTPPQVGQRGIMPSSGPAPLGAQLHPGAARATRLRHPRRWPRSGRPTGGHRRKPLVRSHNRWSAQSTSRGPSWTRSPSAAGPRPSSAHPKCRGPADRHGVLGFEPFGTVKRAYHRVAHPPQELHPGRRQRDPVEPSPFKAGRLPDLRLPQLFERHPGEPNPGSEPVPTGGRVVPRRETIAPRAPDRSDEGDYHEAPPTVTGSRLQTGQIQSRPSRQLCSAHLAKPPPPRVGILWKVKARTGWTGRPPALDRLPASGQVATAGHDAARAQVAHRGFRAVQWCRPNNTTR